MRKLLLFPFLLFCVQLAQAQSPPMTVRWVGGDTLYQSDTSYYKTLIVGNVPNYKWLTQFVTISAPGEHAWGTGPWTSADLIDIDYVDTALRADTVRILITAQTFSEQAPEGRYDFFLGLGLPNGAGYADTVIGFEAALYLKRVRPIPPSTFRLSPLVITEGEALTVDYVSRYPVNRYAVGWPFGPMGIRYKYHQMPRYYATVPAFPTSPYILSDIFQETSDFTGRYTFDTQNLPAGTYDFYMEDQAGHFDFRKDGLTVTPRPGSQPIPGHIQGFVYNDQARNCIYDNTADVPLQNALIRAQNGTTIRYALTDAAGRYTLDVLPGTYQVRMIHRSGLPAGACQSEQTVVVPRPDTLVQAAAFLDSSTATDVAIALTSGFARPGQAFGITLTTLYTGIPITTQSRAVVELDSLLSFVPNPYAARWIDSVVGHKVYMKRVTLSDTTYLMIGQWFIVQLPPDASLAGRTLTVRAHREGLPDRIAYNDVDTLRVRITNSYDPNDKAVDQPEIEPGTKPYLRYTIRFQNTGTDTAFTVVVRDTLSEQLDLETLGGFASSHEGNFALKGNRILEARFPFINLPDSGRDELRSHGSFTFRIKPKALLTVGQSIANQAHIYFDYNTPVATNWAVTQLSLPTAVVTATSSLQPKWLPNPATTTVSMPVGNQPVRLAVRDAIGRLLPVTYFVRNGILTADVSWVQPGVYLFQLGEKTSRVIVQR